MGADAFFFVLFSCWSSFCSMDSISVPERSRTFIPNHCDPNSRRCIATSSDRPRRCRLNRHEISHSCPIWASEKMKAQNSHLACLLNCKLTLIITLTSTILTTCRYHTIPWHSWVRSSPVCSYRATLCNDEVKNMSGLFRTPIGCVGDG